MSLLTPLNVNCHASDGRKVLHYIVFNFQGKIALLVQHKNRHALCVLKYLEN